MCVGYINDMPKFVYQDQVVTQSEIDVDELIDEINDDLKDIDSMLADRKPAEHDVVEAEAPKRERQRQRIKQTA